MNKFLTHFFSKNIYIYLFFPKKKMFKNLSDDVLRIIIIELRNEQGSLYSCILVNRSWCRIAMPILWQNPFGALDEDDDDSRHKLYNTLSYLLPTPSRQLLLDNNIDLPLPTFSKKPLFNYI